MARPRLVALYTDFGTSDVYAGVLRGTVKSMAPEVEAIDVTHGIEPGDVFAAAFALLSAVPFLPRGTVHLCVVDPGVGTSRRVLAVRAAGHTFVGPDNGVLAPVVEALGGPTDLREVTNERLMRKRRSATFHGRDVMAPVVAHLARGIDFANVGDEVAGMVPLPGFTPHVADGRAAGRVLHVDRFGNVITNLLPGDLAGPAGSWDLRVAGRGIERWGTTFADVAPGELLVYPGSVGFLEVAVRDGSAARELPARPGDPVDATRRGV